jgi:hypothetical protein
VNKKLNNNKQVLPGLTQPLDKIKLDYSADTMQAKIVLEDEKDEKPFNLICSLLKLATGLKNRGKDLLVTNFLC